uniref:Uncharacterized protein n=1 Tax=Cyprinus carpio TaxID=7962 RepID=A0A8C1SDH0_CYPCA
QCFTPRVAFGCCQIRLMFPTHFAPDRMGNEMIVLYGSKELGPRCYNNHTVGTLTYELQHRPESKRGFFLKQSTSKAIKRNMGSKMLFCNWAYVHDIVQSKKVSWPTKFGSPDWSKVPSLARKALEFRKQKNRVAYLSLFY